MTATTGAPIRVALAFGYVYPFLLAVVLSIAARGEAVLGPLYSVDTYAQGFGTTAAPETIKLVLSQGRFGTALLLWLGGLFGYHGAGVTVSALLLAMLLFAHAGLLFAQVILKRPSAAEMAVFLILFTLHPFSTEFYHFSDATLVIALATWLAAAGLWMASRMQRGLLWLAGSVAVTVFALSLYQTTLALLLAVSSLALVARLGYLDGAERGPLLRSAQVRALSVAVVSVPVYLLSVRVVAFVTAVPTDARTDLTALGDLPELITKVGLFVRAALRGWPGLLTPAVSLLLLLLLALCSLAVVWAAYRRRGLAIAIICGGLLATAIVVSAGATALGTDWLVPRTVVGISVSSAGVVMLGWRTAPGLRFARHSMGHGLIGAGVILLMLSYVGASNRVLSDQRRLNQWDMQQANRMVMRLESHPGFDEQMSLAVVGGRPGYPSSLATAIGDMNLSALHRPWSKTGLFSQASGYQFRNPTEQEYAAAEDYCATVGPWPADASVAVIEGTGVVCLAG